MVKGNWERRAELAAIRRLEEKQKKEISKSDTNYLSIESVFKKIMNDKLLLNDSSSSLIVWMVVEQNTSISTSCIDFCSSWYRIESCLNKKCKLSHDNTLATHIHNMIYNNNNDVHNVKISNDSHNYITKADENGTNDISNNNNGTKVSSLLLQSSSSLSSPSLVEHECISKLVIDVNTKEMNKIHFISLHHTCIYDYLYPEVWKTWYHQRKLYLQQIQTKTSTITSSSLSSSITTSIASTVMKMTMNDSKIHQLSTIHEISHEKVIKCNNDDNNNYDDYDDYDHVDTNNNVYCVKDNNDIIKNNIKLDNTIIDSMFQVTLNVHNKSNLEYLIEQQNNYELRSIPSLSSLYDMITNVTIYLTNQEFIYFFNLNKNIQKYCIKNDIIRQRKKEIYTIFFNFYNKQKKIEQKKKIKQSHVKKTNKKDAFARGGNAH